MPIHVKAVSQEEYDAWVQSKGVDSKSEQSKNAGAKTGNSASANYPISQDRDKSKDQKK